MSTRTIQTLVAAAVVTSMSFVAASAAVQKPPQKGKASQEKKAAPAKDAPQRGRGHAEKPDRLPPPQQKVLVDQQQQRFVQYGAYLDQQQRLAPQYFADLEKQHRPVQFGVEQRYVAHLRAQQVSLQNARSYNYDGDPYFYTPANLRYKHGGRGHDVNEYGAKALRQAVASGYDEGCAAGWADRQDHSTSNYRGTYAYKDANYGYGGLYVDRDEYNYYFREGFRRGYDDGYGNRLQYGTYESGQHSLLESVLTGILSLVEIR